MAIPDSDSDARLDSDVGAGPTIAAPGLNGFPNGVVYIDGKDTIEYALDLSTGAKIWSFNMGVDSGLRTNSVSTAALIGDTVVVGYSGYVYKLDATTGTKIWRTASPSSTIYASPGVSGAAGDEAAFIGDVGGDFRAYGVQDGSLSFSLNIGFPVLASAAMSGLVFFAGVDGNLYALG